MSVAQQVMQKIKETKIKTSTAFTGGCIALASSPTFAAEDTNAVSAAIDAAIAAGKQNYGAVIVGVILVASLGFCAGMIVGWLKK
ncbi:hypothetical protein [Aeromonas salmonicida]|uniref:hypothetical protein n=1 Tax=Aeromonas salmonicida TaxID=645 RepID=UPI00073CB61B|nr:hypothetical protein [Aeromonas salmonicida]KTA75844.1 hypothetical protein VO69_21480 [Aeromonas salmonicida]MDE7526823.1 hypothetical protein [Aeromonas salmonicida]MDE7530859.1 hypothetical protein [Aeromonas salmonicida]MDE7530870.1 hypothetical protein [Aeromonas salmonicida]